MKKNILFQKIRLWANKKGLSKADPFKQFVKLNEELGELANGMIKNKPNQVVDSLGDSLVVLIILAKQLNYNLEDCLEQAYQVIKNREGEMRDGIFVKKEDL